MMEFWAGFNEALTSVWNGAVGAVLTASRLVLCFLSLLGLPAGLIILSFVRFCLKRADWLSEGHKKPLLIFLWLKWLVIVPSWFVLCLCIANGFMHDMRMCGWAVGMGALVYVIVSLAVYSWEEEHSTMIGQDYYRNDGTIGTLIVSWAKLLRRGWLFD